MRTCGAPWWLLWSSTHPHLYWHGRCVHQHDGSASLSGSRRLSALNRWTVLADMTGATANRQHMISAAAAQATIEPLHRILQTLRRRSQMYEWEAYLAPPQTRGRSPPSECSSGENFFTYPSGLSGLYPPRKRRRWSQSGQTSPY
jgi:hypothetical protein